MCWTSQFKVQFSEQLDAMPLTQKQKNIILDRYINIVVDAERDYALTAVMYVALTNIITIFGVTITALLSLEQMTGIKSTGSTVIFWITWAMSIALTLSNKWIFAFNLHQKYILNIVVLEKYRAEGWTFLSGTCNYAACETYTDRFLLFCTRIEKIKVKQLESSPDAENNSAVSDILATGARTPRLRRTIALTPRGSSRSNPAINGPANDTIIELGELKVKVLKT